MTVVVLLLDHPLAGPAPTVSPEAPEEPARRALRLQIARLERLLSDALVTGFPTQGVSVSVAGLGGPRLLGLGELEALRDDLAERLRSARAELAAESEFDTTVVNRDVGRAVADLVALLGL